MEEIGKVLDENSDIYNEATLKFGRPLPFDLLIEELAELIQEIIHMRRFGVSYYNLSEEIADVLIMLKSILLIYPQLKPYIIKIIGHKTKRLENRIKNE